MAHTISGSLGPSGAGASVFFSSESDIWAQVGAEIIADVSGNFISGLLPENTTYHVTPVLFGAEFSPSVQTVILGTANIAGINWSGVSSYYTLAAPSNIDTFNRGGITQNPIVGWDTLTGDSPLQVVSDQCQSTTLDTGQGPSGGLPSNYSPTSDQYCQYDLAATDYAQLGILELRCDITRTHGVHLEWSNFSIDTPPPGGAVQITSDLSTGNGILFTGASFSDLNPSSHLFNVGDTLLFLAKGNNYYAFLKQGLSIFPLAGGSTDLNPGFGRPGIELAVSDQLSNLVVKNWAAGNVVTVLIGTVISCAPRPQPNTWEIIYTYPLDAGGTGESLVVVGPNQPIQQWLSLTSRVIVPSSPGTSNQISLAIPDLVKWATFGIGNFIIKTPFRTDGLNYFLNAQ